MLDWVCQSKQADVEIQSHVTFSWNVGQQFYLRNAGVGWGGGNNNTDRQQKPTHKLQQVAVSH